MILLHKLHMMYPNFCTNAAALPKLILTAPETLLPEARVQ